MNKPTKRIIISLVIVATATVAAVVAINNQNATKATLTPEDYKQAQEQTAQALAEYSKVEEAFTATFAATTNNAASTVKAANQALNTYKSSAQTISSLNVVASNKAINKAFEAFKKKNDQYVAGVSGYINNKQNLLTFQASECYSNLTALKKIDNAKVATIDTNRKLCQSSIDALGNSGSKGLATYIEELNKHIDQRQQYYDQIESNKIKTEDAVKLFQMTPPDAQKAVQTAHNNSGSHAELEKLANKISTEAPKK